MYKKNPVRKKIDTYARKASTRRKKRAVQIKTCAKKNLYTRKIVKVTNYTQKQNPPPAAAEKKESIHANKDIDNQKK